MNMLTLLCYQAKCQIVQAHDIAGLVLVRTIIFFLYFKLVPHLFFAVLNILSNHFLSVIAKYLSSGLELSSSHNLESVLQSLSNFET